MAIETLVFDEGQITCKINGNKPKWDGCCHSLSGNAGRTVVIIREKTDKQGEASHGNGTADGNQRRNSADP